MKPTTTLISASAAAKILGFHRSHLWRHAEYYGGVRHETPSGRKILRFDREAIKKIGETGQPSRSFTRVTNSAHKSQSKRRAKAWQEW